MSINYETLSKQAEALSDVVKMLCEVEGLEVEVVKSGEDGTILLFIDTPGIPENSEGPKLRVYLNDEPLWENPTYASIGENK